MLRTFRQDRPPAALVSRQAQRPPRGCAVHRAPDRRLVAIAAMLTDGADELDAGRWSEADAAALVVAVAADAYALAYGYAGALAVPVGARLPRHAAAAIARAADAAPLTTEGGQRATA